MSATQEQILDALRRVNDPELHKDLVTLGMVKDIAVGDASAKIRIELTTPACPLKETIGGDIEREVTKLDGIRKVEIEWTARVTATANLQARLPGVKNTIAIGAGKGGVGKSTVAVLAAMGLQREGARVGLMVADVYGPSIPTLLGVGNRQPHAKGEKLVPIEVHGLRVMSIGFLVEPEKAVIWRGPMVHGVVKQFLEQVEWGELDYLIIDLPPGTGDVPLTLSQSIPMTGAVIVCTPQDVALLDAIKALRMYQQLNVGILGMVENMSYFIAPDTGNEYDLFGRGGARAAAQRVSVPFLGEIPFNIDIRIAGDAGTPVTNFEKTDETTRQAITSFVRNLAGQISVRNATKTVPVELKVT